MFEFLKNMVPPIKVETAYVAEDIGGIRPQEYLDALKAGDYLKFFDLQSQLLERGQGADNLLPKMEAAFAKTNLHRKDVRLLLLIGRVISELQQGDQGELAYRSTTAIETSIFYLRSRRSLKDDMIQRMRDEIAALNIATDITAQAMMIKFKHQIIPLMQLRECWLEYVQELSRNRCNLKLMTSIPTQDNLPPGSKSAYVLVQAEANTAPTAVYFVDKSDAIPTIQQVGFSAGNSVATFVAALYPAVTNHVYPNLLNFSDNDLQTIMAIADHTHINRTKEIFDQAKELCTYLKSQTIMTPRASNLQPMTNAFIYWKDAVLKLQNQPDKTAANYAVKLQHAIIMRNHIFMLCVHGEHNDDFKNHIQPMTDAAIYWQKMVDKLKDAPKSDIIARICLPYAQKKSADIEQLFTTENPLYSHFEEHTSHITYSGLALDTYLQELPQEEREGANYANAFALQRYLCCLDTYRVDTEAFLDRRIIFLRILMPQYIAALQKNIIPRDSHYNVRLCAATAILQLVNTETEFTDAVKSAINAKIQQIHDNQPSWWERVLLRSIKRIVAGVTNYCRARFYPVAPLAAPVALVDADPPAVITDLRTLDLSVRQVMKF